MEYEIKNQKIKIPDNFVKGKSMPEDPEDSIERMGKRPLQ